MLKSYLTIAWRNIIRHKGYAAINVLGLAMGITCCLFILLWVLYRSLSGKYTEHNSVNVRLCTMYWHFVDAVWVLMFVSLYLL